MDDNKKIDNIIEGRLRRAETFKPSGNFTRGLMFKIIDENKLVLEESKQNRIAKYVIGSFSFFVIAFTIIIGIVSGSRPVTKTAGTFSIEPTIETSNNLLNQFLSYIQVFFNKILEILGLSISTQTVGIVVGLIIAISLFMLADKVFVKGKLKSR